MLCFSLMQSGNPAWSAMEDSSLISSLFLVRSATTLSLNSCFSRCTVPSSPTSRARCSSALSGRADPSGSYEGLVFLGQDSTLWLEFQLDVFPIRK